jgi:hypothetical protein
LQIKYHQAETGGSQSSVNMGYKNLAVAVLDHQAINHVTGIEALDHGL